MPRAPGTDGTAPKKSKTIDSYFNPLPIQRDDEDKPAPLPAGPKPLPKPMPKSGSTYGSIPAMFSRHENSYDDEDDDEEPPTKRMRLDKGKGKAIPRQPMADLPVNAPAPMAKAVLKTKGDLPRGYNPSAKSIADLDKKRTVTSLPPQRVFAVMADKAAAYKTKKGEDVCGAFITKHGSEKLFQHMKDSIKPELWNHFMEGDKATDLEFLRSLPMEKQFPDRSGWYLGVVEDQDGDEFLALYIGQSVSIISRIGGVKGHKNSVLLGQKKMLLYWFWRGDTNDVPPIPQNSSLEKKLERLPRKCKFITLGTDKSGLKDADAEHFLNIGEMFLALMFRSLQSETLKKWLPDDCTVSSPATGANIQLPILQGHQSQQNFALEDAVNSENSAVTAYADEALGRNLTGKKLEKRNQIVMEKTTVGSREKGKNQGHYRGPDLSLGDTAEVQVACVSCGTKKIDTQPQYLRETGQYLVRRTTCPACAPTDAEKKRGQKHSSKYFEPVLLAKNQWVNKDRLHFPKSS